MLRSPLGYKHIVVIGEQVCFELVGWLIGCLFDGWQDGEIVFFVAKQNGLNVSHKIRKL